MKLGTRETVEVPSIPTGSFGLDSAQELVVYKRRVVKIYGLNPLVNNSNTSSVQNVKKQAEVLHLLMQNMH